MRTEQAVKCAAALSVGAALAFENFAPSSWRKPLDLKEGAAITVKAAEPVVMADVVGPMSGTFGGWTEVNLRPGFRISDTAGRHNIMIAAATLPDIHPGDVLNLGKINLPTLKRNYVEVTEATKDSMNR